MMDAKPQRMRTLRIHDENALPTQPMPTKTIHQRNKSTPALPLLMQGGPLKVGVKRAPFVDLSNTQRITQPAKDDSAINGKGAIVNVQELISKNNALSKPAQRPLAVKTTSQQTVTNISTITTIPTKPAATEVVVPRAQPAISRPYVQKSSIAIPKDKVLVEESVVTSVIDDKDTKKPFTTDDLLAQLKESNAAQSSAIDGVILPPSEAQRPTSSHVSIDAPAPAPSTTTVVEVVRPKVTLPSLHTQPGLVSQQPLLDLLQQQSQALEAEINAALGTKPTDEQLMYGEEEDEELYYDEGYTTSRSLRMKGDTSGGTTVVLLAPKYTAKVKAEIAAAKDLVESSRSPEEVEDEQWDTSMVAEYGDEIFDYMRTLEERMRPNPHYMDHQTECQWSMRAVLMDWLVQVHARFTLLPETLFLSVNYIDRFLSCKVVSLAKLQLVGATAIFLASKYEEVNCPSISEIVYMVDNGYCQEEILKAERFMLSMLAFELGWPGPMSFLRRISKADDYDLETRTLAKYFLEVTIMDERFVGSSPSFLAAGAHCLARLMLRKGDWTPHHVYYSNYTYSQLRQLLGVMVECCEEPMKHHAAVFEKYQDKRYKRASLFVQAEMQNGFRLPGTARKSLISAGWADAQSWPNTFA